MTSRTNQSRSWFLSGPVILACVVTASAAAQTVRENLGAVAVQPLRNEPPAKVVIDSPRAEPLSRGVVFIPYRTENLHIVPVVGPAALAVSPRIGHIHVMVDDATWRLADASGIPVIIMGLAPGRHTILIPLVNANHYPIDQDTVQVTVPPAIPQPETHERSEFSL